MKNIHLLPTDKPSRLSYFQGKLLFDKEEFYKTFISQNIYIISSEEIKKGDYVLSGTNTMIKCMYPNNVVDRDVKKIILTTDQDLINDGVQAIDDEFLEWFIKNPTCEEIEIKLVEFEVDMELGESCIEYGSYYKIIFPREQPYQELFDYLANELGVNALLTQMQEIETIVMSKQKQISYE